MTEQLTTLSTTTDFPTACSHLRYQRRFACGGLCSTFHGTGQVTTTWHSTSLGDGVSAPIYMAEIAALFQPFFEAAGRPAEMAVFTRHEPGRLHCEVMVYFSPAAEQVAKVVGAQPCESPARQGLELLAGVTECWSAIF